MAEQDLHQTEGAVNDEALFENEDQDFEFDESGLELAAKEGIYPNENLSLPEAWNSGTAILPTITDWSSTGKRRAQVKVIQGSSEYVRNTVCAAVKDREVPVIWHQTSLYKHVQNYR